MGSPDFAVPALHALHEAGHTIAAVFCQPPRRAGRGQAVQRCPVHHAADALGVTVHTPARLRNNVAAQAVFAELALDAAVVAAYGLILPLLPRWRGAAPIQAAILAGDAVSGVTIMRMDAGLDTGPMLLCEAVPIGPLTTSGALHDLLAPLGERLILRALADDPPPVPQPAEAATYAPKLTREDGRIDWTLGAAAIERQVRAFDPWPGTFTSVQGTMLKVLAAELAAGAGPPGTVLDDRLTIACGSGAVRLTRVQLGGRTALPADAFLRGHRVQAGTVLA
jgi:methionyl-tRNA formyltransferase